MRVKRVNLKKWRPYSESWCWRSRLLLLACYLQKSYQFELISWARQIKSKPQTLIH